MRSIYIFMLVLTVSIFSTVVKADAMSDAAVKEMFIKLVHAHYESDSDTFWKIVSRFKNPQFENRNDVQQWMEGRLSLQMTYLKVNGLIVSGMARIANEKLGAITFRFDGEENSESRVIVVTAFVNRVIEFDDTVPSHQRTVDQEAVLKLYLTLVNGHLRSYSSDELNFGYTFASTN